jgi:hypothetical protein
MFTTTEYATILLSRGVTVADYIAANNYGSVEFKEETIAEMIRIQGGV